jgi:uncharacterized protein
MMSSNGALNQRVLRSLGHALLAFVGTSCAICGGAKADTLRPEWCSNARTDDEHAICDNDNLSALELRFENIFAAAKKAGRGDAVAIAKDLLAERRACHSDVKCIYDHMDGRVYMLEQIAPSQTNSGQGGQDQTTASASLPATTKPAQRTIVAQGTPTLVMALQCSFPDQQALHHHHAAAEIKIVVVTGTQRDFGGSTGHWQVSDAAFTWTRDGDGPTEQEAEDGLHLFGVRIEIDRYSRQATVTWGNDQVSGTCLPTGEGKL